MTTHVIVTTYNRPEYCVELVERLDKVGGLKVYLYNDGSTEKYPARWPGCVAQYEVTRHHGREEYRKLVAYAFKKATALDWDRLAMIPDDVLPAVQEPFAVAELLWQRITDPNKVLLGVLVDKRGHIRQWKGPVPVRHGDVWMTGWNDLCFYTDETIRPRLPRGFGLPHPLAVGSGTGAIFTRMMRPHGSIYTVHKTLWHHRQGESQMNPWERKIHPL